MKPFLQLVAEDLYEKLGSEMQDTAIVFPGKRASLFFDQYLAQCTPHAQWAPAYLTISDLFTTLSDGETTIADPIKLVSDLYQCYIEATQSNESIDKFYAWGEILLNDFEDIDKNMAPVDELLQNLSELKEMEDADYITPQQKAAIQEFFKNFNPERNTQIKKMFATLWNALGTIYHQFHQRLQQQHLAYEGMLERQVVEHFDATRLHYKHYVFVGFNLLNKVEQTLFSKMKDEGCALFYFDYDQAYMTPRNEASLFMQQNLKQFGNELPSNCFDVMRQPKTVRFAAASSNAQQARYTYNWATQHIATPQPDAPIHNTDYAVVLCNEALLPSVIHAIPDYVSPLNITMGYPLPLTPVYSFVKALLNLQTKGFNNQNNCYYLDSVNDVLNHHYTSLLAGSQAVQQLKNLLITQKKFFPTAHDLQGNEQLEHLFAIQPNALSIIDSIILTIRQIAQLEPNCTPSVENDVENDVENGGLHQQLQDESLFRTHQLLSRLSDLIKAEEMKVDNSLLTHLVERVLTSATIPFHGEPAVGVQVMGVLETRNLDFRNLLVLSLNEGMLPKGLNNTSFIPHNLRVYFGLTTIEKKVAPYAYYFYRLLQRAENVTLVYNNSTEGASQNEMSRFMLQYLVESGQQVEKLSLTATAAPQEGGNTSEAVFQIEKTDKVMEQLHRSYNHALNPKGSLSPTALNTYMNCQLAFYYKYVCKIKEEDEITSEITPREFGNVFHKTAELIYKHFQQQGVEQVQAHHLEQLTDAHIDKWINIAFNSEFFKLTDDAIPHYDGIQLITRAAIKRFVKNLLEYDRRHTPFVIHGMETDYKEVIHVQPLHGAAIDINTGGTIDRLDQVNHNGVDTLRIVDYKTSNTEKNLIRSLDDIFETEAERNGYMFQTFLYSSIVMHKEQQTHPERQHLAVQPVLYYAKKAADPNYSPSLYIKTGKDSEEINNFAAYDAEFRTRLNELLKRMFDPTIPFTATPNADRCRLCSYAPLCPCCRNE